MLDATRKPLRSLNGSLQNDCESGFEAEGQRNIRHAACIKDSC